MFDKIFFVVLVLNATGLFRFVAPQLGVDIKTVSIGLLVLNVLYLVAKWKYIAPLLSRPIMIGWLFMLLAWPLMTLAYAPAFILREIGLQCYYVSLFCCAIVYTMANGLRSFHRVLGVSLVISLFGLVLCMLVPSYFVSVAELASIESYGYRSFGGRSYGFFMQPNAAALGLSFLFIGWFALLKRKNGLIEVGAILVFLAAIFLTGSRAGAVISVFTVALILIPSWRKRWSGGRYVMKIAVLTICLTVGIVVARSYVSSIGWVATDQRDIMGRMVRILNFDLFSSSDLIVHKSSRRGTQQLHMLIIGETPLLGHGIGSINYYLSTGRLFLTAHCDVLSTALEYGVLYPVVFVLLMIRLWLNRNRVKVEDFFQTKLILQFVLILLLLFVINGNLLINRGFFVVWGMYFAMVAYPRFIFNYGVDGKIESYKTRREIKRGSVQSRRPWRAVGVSTSVGYGTFRKGVSRG